MIVSVVCWIGLAVWVSWETLLGLVYPEKYEFWDLAVVLSFGYTAIPVGAATCVAILLARCGKPWWMRGLGAAATCSGIWIVFVVSIQQVDSTAFMPFVVLLVVGLLIGLSVIPTKTDQTRRQV